MIETYQKQNCIFDMATHGIAVNLAKLARDAANPYTIEDGDETYKFNVCAANNDCGDRTARNENQFCFEKDGNYVKLGTFHDIRYIGETFTLSYLDGDSCKDRTYDAYITIECSQQAEEKPVLQSKSDDGCSYQFTWRRPEPCLAQVETKCGQVPLGYDLSSLQRSYGTAQDIYEQLMAEKALAQGVKTETGDMCHFPFTYEKSGKVHKFETCTDFDRYGQYWCCTEEKCTDDSPDNIGLCPRNKGNYKRSGDWEVLNFDNDKQIFLSLCGEMAESHESCVKETAICIDGLKVNATVEDVSEVRRGHLKYTLSGSCGEKTFKGDVLLSCSPGGHSRPPEIIEHSDDFCDISILWRTHAACPAPTHGAQRDKVENSCKLQDSQEPSLAFNLERIAGTHSGQGVKINLCNASGLEEECGDKKANSGVGVCLEVDGKWQPFGKSDQFSLTYDMDGLKMVMDKLDSSGQDVQVVFLCDESRNVGNFRSISPSVYEFHTAAACPPIPVDCAVYENGNFFDLSELYKSDGTVYEALDLSQMAENGGDDDFGRPERKVYAQACGELSPMASETVSCPAGSAVCEPDEKLSYGSALSMKLKLDETKKHIQMIYEKGSTCQEDKNRKWRSVINLYCNFASQDHSPRLLHTTDCVAEFEWSTMWACWMHPKISPNNVCTISNGNVDYDFTPLSTNKPLEAVLVDHNKGVNSTYLISICGTVEECCHQENHHDPTKCDISACRKGSKGHASHHSERKLRLAGDRILLEYSTGVESDFEYVIDLVCDRKAGHLEEKSALTPVDFIDGRTFLLEYRTAFACAPMAGSCYTHDENGNRYDLSALNGITWTAEDDMNYESRFGMTLCGSVPNLKSKPMDKYTKCADLAVLTQGYFIDDGFKNDADCYSLGMPRSVPHVSVNSRNESLVTIELVDGSVCKDNTNLHYSALVELKCSASQHELQYGGQTASCEHFFYMETPTACRTYQTTSEFSDCSFIDPIYGVKFDLSSLNTDGYIVKDNETEYKFNVCGEVKDCGGGICLKSGDKWGEYGGGTGISEALYYSDGIAHLTYIGTGLCEEYELTPTTRIEFRCGAKNEKPKVIHNSECELAIDFPTDLMCHETEIIDCTVSDEKFTNNVDLSPLARESGNYVVDHYDENNEVHQYVLNVCRSVTHQKGIICPPKSAACEKFGSKQTTEMTYKSIGELNQTTFSVEITSEEAGAVERGDYEIIMTMPSEEKCENSESKSTVIKFICDKSAVVSEPYFGSDDGCTTIFVWKTAYACVSKAETSDDCKLSDPITGFNFDMNSLPSSTFTDTDTDLTYHVGICKAAEGCTHESAVCVSKDNENEKSLGSVSRALTHANGGLSLTYTDGELCNVKSSTNYTSVLRFQCDKNFSGNIDVSLLASTDGGCVNHFTVRTEKACQPTAECAAVRNGDQLELGELVPSHGHQYVSDVDDDEGIIYINLCSPLEPIVGVPCPHGSIVCRRPFDGTPPVSLGDFDPTSEWLWPEGSTPEITYTSSDHCTRSDTGEKSHYKVKIKLTCDRGRENAYPILSGKEEGGCLYLINWVTAVACEEDQEVDTDTEIDENGDEIEAEGKLMNCIYNVDDKYIDFNTIDPVKILQPGGSEYFLDLCGKEAKCDTGALCEKPKSKSDWESIGDRENILVEKDLKLTSAIKFELKIPKSNSVNSQCSNGKT